MRLPLLALALLLLAGPAFAQGEYCAHRPVIYYQHFERREFRATFAGWDVCGEDLESLYLCPRYDRTIRDVPREPGHPDMTVAPGVPCIQMPTPDVGNVIGWEIPLEAFDVL